MTKQLLLYEQVTPVNKVKHADWSVKVDKNYEFARSVNSLPLMAVEFPNAAVEYAVVFAGKDDDIMPVVIMGLRDQENLYLSKDGTLNASYIPAFLRRYPFVFSTADDGANFLLCIDELFAGWNQKGIGERLFDSEGEQTQYLKNTLSFLKEYQAHFARTQKFCRKLKELDLLEPMGVQYTPPQGERMTLTGFMVVNREKLQSLSGEQYQQLAKTGELELAFVHLQSLRNFTSMLGLISTSKENQDSRPEVVEENSKGKPKGKSKSKNIGEEVEVENE